MIYRLVFCLALFFGVSVEASFVSYKSIENFHKSRIETLSQEYDLKHRAQITYSLLPAKGKLKAQPKSEILKLPGLLLDAVSLNSVKKEVGLFEIMEELKSYDRKIVILKSSKFSDKEVKVLQQALQDELFISDPASFEVKKWSINQLWYNNLKSSFQNKVMASPYTYIGLFAFLIISCLLFMLSSSILKGFKHVGKSIFDSVEKSISNAGGGEPYAEPAALETAPLAANSPFEDQFGGGLGQESGAGDKAPDCHAILKLISKAVSVKPNELKFQMWEVFPEVSDQLSLYIAFETELQSSEMESFSKLFNSIFRIESRKEDSEAKAKSSSINSNLWKLRLTLTHLVVKPLNETREKVFGLFIENYNGQLDAIIEGSVSKHFKTLSYLFKEKVSVKVSTLKELNEDFSDQILSYVASGADQKTPTDLEIKNFKTHLADNKFFLSGAGEETREKDFELLSRLPDHILFSNTKLEPSMLEEINKNVPNLSWIDISNKKVHKSFVLSLSPDEATHFMNHFDKIEEFKEQTDTRTASRMQELQIKSKHSESVQAIMGLRQKIKRFYIAPPVETIDELKTAA